jgi:O-antigen ligase
MALVLVLAFLAGLMLMASVETFHARRYDHERVLLWTAAWQMFLDHPVTGVGLLHFNDAYMAHYLSPLAKEPNLPHPHNLFLDFLAETGLVGFSAYMLLVLGQVVIAFRFTQNGTGNLRQLTLPDMFILSVAGMLGHGMVDVLATTRDQMLLYFFLWGVVCLYFKTREDVR